MTTNQITRARFLKPLVAWCRENGFHGIDFDWEHPRNLDQLHNYAALLAETRMLTRPHKMLVTAAQAGWQILPRKAYAAVDRIHLMAYDHPFPQATLEKTIKDCGELINRWCPPHKTVLGVPFYGRNSDRAALTYADLVGRFPDEIEKGVAGGYAFNNRATLAAKMKYAKQQRLAGIMIWELGQDSTGPAALLPHIVGADEPVNRVAEKPARGFAANVPTRSAILTFLPPAN